MRMRSRWTDKGDTIGAELTGSVVTLPTEIRKKERIGYHWFLIDY